MRQTQGSATAPRPTSTSTTPTDRRTVRRRVPTDVLTAYPITAAAPYHLLDGTEVQAEVGAIAVCRGGYVIDVCAPALFARLYEPVDENAMTLSGDAKSVLASTLGLGAIESETELVGAVGRLARLQIGGIQIDFSTSQWAELRHRADKRGIPVEQLVAQIVQKLTADIWVS